MKRIFLVLALALTLLFGVWGQAFAMLIDDDDENEDHPWGGSTSSGEQPQYRNMEANTGVLLCSGFLPIDIVLSDGVFLKELRNIFIDTSPTSVDRSSRGNTRDASTTQTSVR